VARQVAPSSIYGIGTVKQQPWDSIVLQGTLFSGTDAAPQQFPTSTAFASHAMPACNLFLPPCELRFDVVAVGDVYASPCSLSQTSPLDVSWSSLFLFRRAVSKLSERPVLLTSSIVQLRFNHRRLVSPGMRLEVRSVRNVHACSTAKCLLLIRAGRTSALAVELCSSCLNSVPYSRRLLCSCAPFAADRFSIPVGLERHAILYPSSCCLAGHCAFGQWSFGAIFGGEDSWFASRLVDACVRSSPW